MTLADLDHVTVVITTPELQADVTTPQAEVQLAPATYRPTTTGLATRTYTCEVTREHATLPAQLHLPTPGLTGAATLFLYVNGLRQRPTDWSYDPATAQLSFHDHPLYPGDDLTLTAIQETL